LSDSSGFLRASQELIFECRRLHQKGEDFLNAPGQDVKTPLSVVGVGFGPSNLALAIALTENEAFPQNSLAFFERQESFGWHRGMLLREGTLQVSFLKDLVTLRDPTSSFSFLSYLKDRDRLIEFVNGADFYPLRLEFHDYLEWAAERMTRFVMYGTEVTSLSPVWESDGRVDHVALTVRQDGLTREVHARNVILAMGLRPTLPDEFEKGHKIWHSEELLDKVGELDKHKTHRLLVVGGGQSAAEVAAYLHREFPNAEVHIVMARYGFSVSDDSPFANRIFDPQAVNHFFQASYETRSQLLAYHRNTNYSVVDLALIQDLYRIWYTESVTGERRLFLHNVSKLLDIKEVGDGLKVEILFQPTGSREVIDVDAVVFATGYRPVDPLEMLGDLARYCKTTPRGDLRLGRNYRVVTDDTVTCGIFVQGATEMSHGISSTLLSNISIRAGEIREALLEDSRGENVEFGSSRKTS